MVNECPLAAADILEQVGRCVVIIVREAAPPSSGVWLITCRTGNSVAKLPTSLMDAEMLAS